MNHSSEWSDKQLTAKRQTRFIRAESKGMMKLNFYKFMLLLTFAYL
jgi:hypothetical protein